MDLESVAIIQTIGKKAELKFYSYCPQNESLNEANEYLYENYLGGYKRFLAEVRRSAQEYREGVIIRTDIKSYYTMIVREQLLDITKRELDINSQRIYWLLNKIYSVNFDGHQSGRGISQGTTTSGFYANLYLSNVDKKFDNNKTWRAKFHRYVDDIIIVLPSSTCLEDVESTLKNQLKALELELNEDKTEHYDNVSDFLETIENDKTIEKLSKKFNLLIYRLWVLDTDYRTKFEFANKSGDERLWWNLITLYQQCLYSINIHVTETYLSRKIYQYLFWQDKIKNNILNLPSFPNSDNYSIILNWAKRFEELEKTWLHSKDNLKKEIINFLTQSLLERQQIIKQINKIDSTVIKRQNLVQRRRLETRIRFSINKLIILGFDEVWQEIVSLICCEPSVIRDLLDVIVSLAKQGYIDAINQLKEYYQNSSKKTSEYIRAVIIEALRFLPSLNIADWKFVFEAATEGISDIERLKATETWLYLGDLAKQFVQDEHIQAVVNLLNSEPQPFTRLKKNYILILGMYAPDKIMEVSISPEERHDYLINDALDIAEKGKALQLLKEDEPAIIRQYYTLKKTSDGEDSEDKHYYSL